MKLIIFLGNPGLKYRRTRHNIGFMTGDFYAKSHGVKWRNLAKFDAEIAVVADTPPGIASAAKQSSSNKSGLPRQTSSPRNDTLLIKPQKFYNLTGEVVRNLVKFYKISRSDILVVCDDLNLPFGRLRYRQAGSDGGNNGLKSIIAQIGPDFARLRIGSDNPLRAQIGDTDFVLSKLSRDEQQQLPGIFSQTTKLIDNFNQ
jgi:PTH1 family peptidyl-tRNA hydrolase